MLICDTSGLLAFFDGAEPRHRDTAAVIAGFAGPRVVSHFVVAELDYLVASRRGHDAEVRVLRELFSGRWEIANLTDPELEQACTVVERYGQMGIGVADASMVILADRYKTTKILTLDTRHFTVLRTASGHTFDILPQVIS